MADKKVIVITGATSGIGRELLDSFYQDEKFQIFAAYRNPEKIEHHFKGVDYFYMDLLDDDSIVKAADYIKSKVDKIDILINAAGAVVAGPVELIPLDKLKEQFQVNTFSHIHFVRNLFPVLEGSRVINMSSMASFGHFPFISPYCASKRSLDIFFNAFLMETHRNIEVVSIKSGVVSTPIWGRSVKANEDMLQDCAGFEQELDFLRRNALANTQKGLNVKVAAKKIKKIALKHRVKSSYLIGKDAFFALIFSFLPQDVINYLVKSVLKLRISHK